MSETETVEQPTKVSDLGKAVAVIERGGGHSMVVPDNMNQQIEFAKVMSTGGAMIGKPFRNSPGACLGICNQAWQWGMNPFSVSQKAYLVNDIIAFEAQLVHAVVLKLAPLAKRPRFTYEGEGDQRRCTVTFWVRGEDEPLTYTSPPFGKITPKNSPLWKTDPDQQQAYYTIRAGSRRYFPEVLMGVLDYEEAVEIVRVEGEKTKPITLTGQRTDTDNIPEAEFSDGTAILAKNAEKQKAKNQEDAKTESAKKKAAPKDGLKGDGPGETSAPGADAGARATPPESTAPSLGHGADAGDTSATTSPNEPEAGGEAEDADDEKLVSEIEAALNPSTPMANRKLVKANSGALNRIGATSEDAQLAGRANRIIAAWVSK